MINGTIKAINVEGLGSNTAEKVLNIRRETIWRWRKELNLLGEEGLIPGNGSQNKGIKRKGRPKSLNFHEMTKQELIEYIEVMNDIKKVLSKIDKEEIFYDFAIEEKISKWNE